MAVTLAVLAVRLGEGASSAGAIPPGRDGLTIRGSPWTALGSGVGKQSTVTAGSPVRYAFRVYNSTGAAISASVRFDAYWGTSDQPPVNIFNLLFQVTVQPGLRTVYSPRTVVPRDALPGAYSEQADIEDLSDPADHVGQYGTFQVAGWKVLSVPSLVRPVRFRPQGLYDGADAVAMVLKSRSSARASLDNIDDFIAGVTQRRRRSDPAAPAPGIALEEALEQFGVPEAAISQISLSAPGRPEAQVTAMAIAVRNDSAVIAFVDGSDLPAPGTRRPDATGLWLVVAGFGDDPGGGAEVLVDDPVAGSGAERVGIAAFDRAVADAAGLPAAQQEPGHIAAIIVSPPS
jgi:hypothetical protein